MKLKNFGAFEFHAPTDGEMFMWKGPTMGYDGSATLEKDVAYNVVQALNYDNKPYFMIINGKGELYTVPAHMGIIVLKEEK